MFNKKDKTESKRKRKDNIITGNVVIFVFVAESLLALPIDDGKLHIAVVEVYVPRFGVEIESDVFRIFRTLAARITLQMPLSFVGVVLRDNRSAFQNIP